MLVVVFSGLYYIHYLQALLGVDSFNSLHWNYNPWKTECRQEFTIYCPSVKAESQPLRNVCHSTSPLTLLEETEGERGMGAGDEHRHKTLATLYDF